MAACKAVDKSTNELPVGDHASDDSDWASEGATPWRFRTGSPHARFGGLTRGVAPSLACPRGAGDLVERPRPEVPHGAQLARPDLDAGDDRYPAR
jgi:hypothetical protein